MIIGDNTAHGGHSFHSCSAVVPAADKDDDNDSGEDDLEYLDNAPINPATVQAVLSSDVTSTLLTLDPQPHTNTSISSSSSIPVISTLISSLLPFNNSIDVDLMAPLPDIIPGAGAEWKQAFTTASPPPTIFASSGLSDSPSSSNHFSLSPSSNPLSNNSPILNLTSSKCHKSLLAPAASSWAPSVGTGAWTAGGARAQSVGGSSKLSMWRIWLWMCQTVHWLQWHT